MPFAWVGRNVDVWGTLRHVVVQGAGEELVRHARGTEVRLLIDPERYEGPSRAEIERPTPLGQRAGLSSASRHSLLRTPDREQIVCPLDDYVRMGGGAPMSAASGTVDLDVAAERCQSLKLVHAAECLAELVEEASRDDLNPVKFLDRVLECEIERKNERRIATSLRVSGLPVGKTLKGFDLFVE